MPSKPVVKAFVPCIFHFKKYTKWRKRYTECRNGYLKGGFFMIDFIVIGLLSSGVVFAVLSIIKQNKKGGCCSGCSGCAYSQSCKNKKN